MNYFILNNSFHYSYITKFFNKKSINSTLLINEHNFNRTLINNSNYFKIIYFKNSIQTYKDSFKIKKFNTEYDNLISELNEINETDSLYVLSEQDLMNLKIINYFKDKGSKIYLLEDGTFTPVYLSINKNYILFKKIPLYLICISFFNFIVKKLSINNIEIGFIYNLPVFKFNDKLYTKAIITNNYDLNRNIKEIEIIKENTVIEKKKDFDDNFAVFVNSPHNIEIGQKYFTILTKAIKEFQEQYKCENILFCFHPREREIDKLKIINSLNVFSFIKFELNLTTRDVILNNTPKYLVSFMSTTLLEYRNDTSQIIFLIEKYPEIIYPQLSKQMIRYIKTLNI